MMIYTEKVIPFENRAGGKGTGILRIAMEDEQLVPLSREGNDRATEELFDRYKNYVRARARSYFLIGADREDIIQEGMIGLYKAIRDYRQEKQVTFRAFAEICITRQMITAVKTATRQKHIPLNSYVSLNKPVFDDDSDRTLIDMIAAGKNVNPEELLIGQEEYAAIESSMGTVLSDLERQVLALYLAGKSYQQIAETVGRNEKSIDNALQRVKRKLERCLLEKEE